MSLPHVRGGVSRQNAHVPHVGVVFPTCVGVFLPQSAIACPFCGLPHVRGGVSVGARSLHVINQSSPRAWGCFLFSRVVLSFF